MKVDPNFLEIRSWLEVSTNSKEPSYLANYWIVPGSFWHPFGEPLERHLRQHDSHSSCEWPAGSDCVVHYPYEVWMKISTGVYLCNSITRHPYLVQTDQHVSSNWCSMVNQLNFMNSCQHQHPCWYWDLPSWTSIQALCWLVVSN